VFTSAVSVGVSAAGVAPPMVVLPTALPTNTPAPPTCGAKYSEKVRSEKQDEVHFLGVDSVLALNVNRSLVNDMAERFVVTFFVRKYVTSCSKSANKWSTSCVRIACPKLSTSLEEAVNNL
jgi:hypothetical protein